MREIEKPKAQKTQTTSSTIEKNRQCFSNTLEVSFEISIPPPTRTFFPSSFTFTEKLSRRYRDNPYTPYSHMHVFLYYQHLPLEWVHFVVTMAEPTLTHHYHPKFIVYIQGSFLVFYILWIQTIRVHFSGEFTTYVVKMQLKMWKVLFFCDENGADAPENVAKLCPKIRAQIFNLEQ